jgi:ATP-dependent protease ClpP protease subunit
MSKDKDTETESSDTETEEKDVISLGTSIYFYADVTEETITKLILQLKKMENRLKKKAIDLEGYKPKIKLFIRSNGGDVYAGFSGMEHISGCKVPVTTIADGFCASAATFLLLAGKLRIATPSTQLLIHQISTNGFWGKYEELKDEMETCNKIMESLKTLYKEKTKIPEKKLNKLMKRDITLSAQQCLDLNVIDRIAYP